MHRLVSSPFTVRVNSPFSLPIKNYIHDIFINFTIFIAEERPTLAPRLYLYLSHSLALGKALFIQFSYDIRRAPGEHFADRSRAFHHCAGDEPSSQVCDGGDTSADAREEEIVIRL